MTQVPVRDGMSASVPLTSGERFTWPLAEGERLETEITLDHPLTAPISTGTPVGEAVFRFQGAEVGRVSLLCGRNVLPKLQSAMGVLRLKLPE